MEGVFVKADEEGQTVTFEAQTRGSKQAATAQANIMVVGGDGALVDNAIVRFDGGQTLKKFSLRQGSTKLYIPQDGNDYAVVRSEGMGEMPVNFKAEKNGTYTISVNPEGVAMAYLHLIDNMTGADVDLLAAKVPELVEGPTLNDGVSTGSTTSYTFPAKTTDNASRFKLVFVCGDANDDNDSFAFYSNGNWIIANEGEATLQVIDVTGRILSSETVNGSVNKSINQPAGVYMIRLINGENVKVQKIVVR